MYDIVYNLPFQFYSDINLWLSQFILSPGWQLAEPCKFTKWLCDLQISVSYCKLAYSCLVLKIKIDQKDVIENILIVVGVYKIQQYYYVDNSVSLNHENIVSKINLHH